MHSAHNPRFVAEVCSWASRDPEVLESLLEPQCGAVVDRALQIIVDNIESIPITSSSLLNRIFRCRPDNEKLIDTTIRSAIGDYVRSAVGEPALDELSGQPLFAIWLGSGKTWRLAGAIRAGISGVDSCSRGWEVVYKLPDAVYERDVVVSIIESLFPPTAQYCSPATVQTWVRIIQRARGNVGFEVDLCGQAVRFAFGNPDLPVSHLPA